MSKFNKQFSDAPWSNTDVSMATGNKVIINAKEHMICEILPVKYPDINATTLLRVQYLEEEAANEQLIRMSPNMFNTLESVLEELKAIKEGKLTVFEWDLPGTIKNITTLLERATDS